MLNLAYKDKPFLFFFDYLMLYTILVIILIITKIVNLIEVFISYTIFCILLIFISKKFYAKVKFNNI